MSVLGCSLGWVARLVGETLAAASEWLTSRRQDVVAEYDQPKCTRRERTGPASNLHHVEHVEGKMPQSIRKQGDQRRPAPGANQA
jgi:hypothetical protein